MILPDVNLLVYAFREDAEEHQKASAWLADVLGGAETLALHESVLSGFVRIVTNPRIMHDPAPASLAARFVRQLVAAGTTRLLAQEAEVWRRFAALCESDSGIRGNLVPDALLAATCLTHGCRLATRDRGFARFDGLRWFDPLRDR